jgi:hypothetical protein
VEFLQAVIGHPLSVGSVFNIVHGAVSKALEVNFAEDLSPIGVGAHDEIYQGVKPVLVGVDVKSTYCYLLNAEDHCDETTWGVTFSISSSEGCVSSVRLPMPVGVCAPDKLPHGGPCLVKATCFTSNDYLKFLRYFLNNRRFLSGERPDRIGKSPAHLATGKALPSWLELLGFPPFRHNWPATLSIPTPRPTPRYHPAGGYTPRLYLFP